MKTKNLISFEIFSSLISVDGRGETLDYFGEKAEPPLTEKDREKFIKELYANTKYCLKLGLLIPFALGHEDQNPLLIGEVKSVELLARKKTETLPAHFVLICKGPLDHEIAVQVDEGLLPGISVDVYPACNLSAYSGKTVGPYVGAVTLSGKVPVAQPWLKRITGKQTFSVKMNSGGQMTPEEKASLYTEFEERFLKRLGEQAEDGDADGPVKFQLPNPADEFTPPIDAKGKKEEKKAPKEASKFQTEAEKDEISTLKAEIEFLKEQLIEQEYDKMLSAGKIMPDAASKAEFKRIVGDSGLKFAKQFYSRQATAEAPTEKSITAAKEKETEADKNRIREAYKALGLADEQIEKLMAMVEERKKKEEKK